MAWVLDTDIISLLHRPGQGPVGLLQERLRQHHPDAILVTAVSLQEQMKGWLAQLNRVQESDNLLLAYEGLTSGLRFFCASHLLSFSAEAETTFRDLRKQRIRISTMDLRIASITLATGNVLVSRNLKDFQKVPGLQVEDWTT